MVKQGQDHFGVGVCDEDDPAGNRFLPVLSGGEIECLATVCDDLSEHLTISSRMALLPLTGILYKSICFRIKLAASHNRFSLRIGPIEHAI